MHLARLRRCHLKRSLQVVNLLVDERELRRREEFDVVVGEIRS